MLQESFDILEPMFINNIIPASGHGLLATEENWMGLLNSLPEAADAVRTNLGSQWAKSHSSPLEKWDELKKHLDAFIRQSSKAGSSKKASKNITTKERNRLETWIYEIVFRYTYPRLDVNVSKARNHLLKSPFCVHPKSGRVCVPVKVETMDTFDPFAVPTVSQVLNELDEYEKHHATMDNDENDEPMDSGASKRMKGNASTNWQKTSLKQYYEPFQNDFLDPLLRKMRRNQRDAKDQHAAMLGDF